MPKSNAKNDNPDQTDEKLTTLESLLRMVSMADEQKILQEENDIYIYLAALRHLEERVGEKKHETLLSKEEKSLANDLGKFFKINYNNKNIEFKNFFSKGKKLSEENAYTSKNTNQLDEVQTLKLLKKSKILKDK